MFLKIEPTCWYQSSLYSSTINVTTRIHIRTLSERASAKQQIEHQSPTTHLWLELELGIFRDWYSVLSSVRRYLEYPVFSLKAYPDGQYRIIVIRYQWNLEGKEDLFLFTELLAVEPSLKFGLLRHNRTSLRLKFFAVIIRSRLFLLHLPFVGEKFIWSGCSPSANWVWIRCRGDFNHQVHWRMC